MNKWINILIMIVYFIVSIVGIKQIPYDERFMVLSSPFMIYIAMICVIWFNSIFFEKKFKLDLIISSLWLIVNILGFIINDYILYGCILLIIINAFVILNTKTNQTKDFIIKYHDFSVLGSSFFAFVGTSMFLESNQFLLYTIMTSMLLVISLLQIFLILQAGELVLGKLSLVKKLSIIIVGVLAYIPVMYSIKKNNGGITISLENMIYTLILLLYPMISIRMLKIKSKRKLILDYEG
ncbi:hypothetical protein BN85400850 [Alteracholeplasma palmae J233]|uniref:Uncharacterized protein n=1 Tax=Alteracholeplasma palmae (strain ATCC 49389 / J233) TaxID=1318466 RepID=U4KJQ7_ALTPJ|nr:hypothetical protein [Alteracholeplasma palmae]CCV63662.1 hypothetical protein BN85400850 [Alteracholeplasma palmae J233]